jgi:hypothetical protein
MQGAECLGKGSPAVDSPSIGLGKHKSRMVTIGVRHYGLLIEHLW